MIWIILIYVGPSQWPHGLRRRSAAARLLRFWVRIPPRAWISVVSVMCCQAEVSATSWWLGLLKQNRNKNICWEEINETVSGTGQNTTLWCLTYICQCSTSLNDKRRDKRGHIRSHISFIRQYWRISYKMALFQKWSFELFVYFLK